ncbi:hypothetical protein MMC07_004899 [Pseudocyphellaria aurata]|nr:hypothetical protein [Pseudocyphellaria aurata]
MATNHEQDVQASNSTKELIPNRVDHLAQVTPHALYAEYPVLALTYEEGYRRITYGEFANVINGLAWWLHGSLGPGRDSEVLAYIGPNDLRYPALILGAVKAGYVMFLTSPRNSVAAQINLLNRLKCKTMISPTPRPPPVITILEAVELHVLEIPSVQELLSTQNPLFPFKMTFAEASSKPLFTVHTSGSTGMPKPLTYTHETGARNINMVSMNPPPGFESQDQMYQNKRIFITFPPFHGAFLVSHFFNAIPFGTVMIAPTSGEVPSAQGLVDGLKRTPADIAFIVPSIVQELSQSPELLDFCAKNLEIIMYCGGDLPQSIGDVIASKIRLVNQYGASELGLIALLQSKPHRDPEDWKYVQFHPATGAELHHVTDDVHELCIVRDPKREMQQPPFTFFPDLQKYPTRDLFVRHPSKDKKDLWRWHARADDIIVFINGEKTNPISMEQFILSRSPEVAAVLVAGTQRFQAALLIEPFDGKELTPIQRANLIERIWPIIQEANKDCPSHAQLAKSHILFTQPQKPMLRAGKGTIQRAGTLGLYAKELDSLYADADLIFARAGEKSYSRSARLDDFQALSHFVKESISATADWPTLDINDNFFSRGMDSFQALMTVRKLKQGLNMPDIAISTIYTNPSVSALASAILQLSKERQVSQQSDQQARFQTTRSLVEEYQNLIDQIPTKSETAGSASKQTIILTGSSGALGTYILNVLLANSAVTHIYCINRSHDGLLLQNERNQARGLSTELSSARVTFLAAEIFQTNLGLEPEIYSKLLENATLVIHCAWPVNFNLSVSAFRPQFSALVNLIEFTAHAATSPHLFFISSVSSVLSYQSASLQTPEEIILDNSAPSSTGYAESKYISERLLGYAAQRLSIKSSVARVGQVAGAVKYPGLWNKDEWFPSLVISSLHVGLVPDSLGSTFSRIDWVPIDLLAEVIVDLALGIEQTPIQNSSQSVQVNAEPPRRKVRVFHPLNPHPTTWEAVRPTLIEALSSATGKQLGTVSPDVWLTKVREEIEAAAGSRQALKDGEIEAFLRVNPAVKLIGFYEDLFITKAEQGNVLEIEETERSSAKLHTLEGLKVDWIQKWVQEWVASIQRVTPSN